MDTIASRLAAIRKTEGLTLREFADRVGVSHAAVGGYEGKTGKVPAEYVAAVAKAFGYSPGWLLTGEGLERTVEPGEAEVRLALIDELMRLLPVIATAEVRDAKELVEVLRAVRLDREQIQARRLEGSGSPP